MRLICRLLIFNKDAIWFDFKISFRGEYVFNETRTKIIVLKTSLTKVRNLLISFVVVFFFFNKVV